MRNFDKSDIDLAKSGADSYKDFKENLKLMGYKVPVDTKIPFGMKNWVRILRYEVSKDFSFGTPTTAHDMRQKAYYERLDSMGCPNPLLLMN